MMWSNLSNVVGAAIQQVQKIQSEIEIQMDEAVGAAANRSPSSSSASTTIPSETSPQNKPITNHHHPKLSPDTRSSSSFSEVKEAINKDEKLDKFEEITLDAQPFHSSEDNSNNLQERIEDLTEENKILLERNMQLEERLRSKEKSLKSLEEINASFSTQLQQLQEQNSALQQQLKVQGQSTVKLQEELDTAKESFTKATVTSKQEANTALAKWSEEKVLLESKVQQLNETIRKLQESPIEQNQTQTSTNKFDDSWQEERKSLEANIQQLNEQNHRYQQSINSLQESSSSESVWSEERKSLLTEIQQLKQRLQDLETNLSSKQEESLKAVSTWNAERLSYEKKIQQCNDEVHHIQEVVKERERALETSTLKASELYKQCEDLNRAIHDLRLEIAEKDAIIRQNQTSHLQESEIKKELNRLIELMKEKDEKLLAFEEEGTKLSKKQSEMEKLVRKSRTEVKEKETEIAKLKESKDQLVKAVEQTQDALKKQEHENSNLTKTLNAMNAVSQATADKLNKLESEIHMKNEEHIGQRKALENAWSENNEMKRLISELKAERDDLRRQIGEGTSKVIESESFRREIEQREAILKATSMQLQDNLRNQMQESILREERLREEINDLRKKWQEAVASREALSSELTSATSPLLRQITSLQETLRLRSEQWQSIESQLTERLLRAENSNETFEQRKLLLEEQINQLKQQFSTTKQKLSETQLQLSNLQIEFDKTKKNEMMYLEERDEFEKRWNEENLLRQNALNSLREMELKFKIERQEQYDSNQSEIMQRDLEIKRLQQELNSLIQSIEENGNSPRDHSNQSHRQNSGKGGGGGGGAGWNHGNQYGVQEVKASEKNYIFQDNLSNLNLASGERSFIANEKTNLRNQQKEEGIKALQAQINQLETSRNALLEEVSYLSARNDQLEDELQQFPQLKSELAEKQKQLEVSLVLLGEKEEELEGLLNDMKEVKNMYRSHIEELLQKVLPTEKTPSIASPSIEQQT